MSNLKDMEAQAVDLSKKQADTEAAKLARAREAEAAAIVQVALWDRAMNRAFKGIVKRPTRHRLMVEAAARSEREADR